MQVVNSQSHNVHKAVAFEPLAPAALFLRILITCVVIKVTCAVRPNFQNLRSCDAMAAYQTRRFESEGCQRYQRPRHDCA